MPTLPPRAPDESWAAYLDRLTDPFFPASWDAVAYARVGALLCVLGLVLLGAQDALLR